MTRRLCDHCFERHAKSGRNPLCNHCYHLGIPSAFHAGAQALDRIRQLVEASS